MRKPFSNSAEIRFIDREKVIGDLRSAALRAKSAHPEIRRVLLFGSLVQGNYTADSDADLIVVVERSFPDLLDRSRYQIHSRSIPTDTLVYSEREFEQARPDPESFLGQALTSAIDLLAE
jgi:predicted nucleotidyltransferase